MALSTLSKYAMRSSLAARMTPLVRPTVNTNMAVAPMATTAHEQMKAFWEKNLRLNRPNSPWTIYKFHLPMATSLCHRITGIAMGVVLYGIAMGTFVAPGDFPSYIEFLKGLDLGPMVWFPLKTMCAFPLVYHYINGIRHLSWDAGYGMKLPTQIMTGKIIVASAITIAALCAGAAYM